MARLVNGFAAFASALMGLLFGNTAVAQEALPPGWLDSQVDERGAHCQLASHQLLEKRIYLACGGAGVWEVALEEAGPRFLRSYAFDGDAVGFFSEPDGRLWVKVHSLTARPLSAGTKPGSAQFPEPARPALPPIAAAPSAVTPPPPPPPPPPAAKPRVIGRVEAAKPGEVLVSLGAADHVSRGDRVELYWPVVDEDDGSDELLAVGVVASVSERTARVRLGLNESAAEGAAARLTRAQVSASLAAPPRAASLWELDVMARPFAAMGELGGGLLLSAELGRRFEKNWHVRAVLDPAAIADVQDNGSVSAASFTLLGSYDSRYFEMGLGVGAQTVNESDFLLASGSGLTVAQYLRLGPADGLNISARTSIVLFHSQFDFGGMVATGQIPVARGFWLLLGGGGGAVGYGYGEFGLRVLMAGNGARGSKFLTVTAGGAAVFEGTECDAFGFCTTRTYGGPMAGIGGEWRF